MLQAVVLHPVPRGLRQGGGRHDHAGYALLLEVSVQPVAGGAGFIAAQHLGPGLSREQLLHVFDHQGVVACGPGLAESPSGQ